MYARDLPTAELGVVESDHGQLSDLLDERDSSLRDGRFSLVGAIEPDSGRVASAGLVQDLGSSPELGSNVYSVFLLEEERLQDVVRSGITELKNGVDLNGTGELGVGESLSIARELSAPGAGLGSAIAGELIDPAVNMAKGALGLGEASQVRDIAQQLAYQGATPESVSPQSEQFRSLIASRAPNLVPAEALEMDASMPAAGDDLLESSELADGTMAGQQSEDANRAPSVAANENIGNTYGGVIQSMDDELVLQRVGDDLVSHRAELFDDRELSVGKSMDISYEHDGPTVSARSLARELGIER